jgi:lysozyme
MPTMVPNSKPRLSAEELHKLMLPFDINREKYPLVVVGIRGYYRDTMGAPGVNDRGIYDDALFFDTPSATVAFNGNTDPSRYRPGEGTGEQKGMAVLKAGAWFAHTFDLHRDSYMALCQRSGKVTVIRDGSPPYEDTGMFGINIHRGGYNTTSSEGCQTIHPSQWESFINLAIDQAKRFFGQHWQDKTVPYVLLEQA